jgi:hypothetical protein
MVQYFQPGVVRDGEITWTLQVCFIFLVPSSRMSSEEQFAQEVQEEAPPSDIQGADAQQESESAEPAAGTEQSASASSSQPPKAPVPASGRHDTTLTPGFVCLIIESNLH